MSQGHPPSVFLALCIYVVEFITSAIVMSFEMLLSARLAPYFGSDIYTWASLISTVLAASCVGYFLGGVLADRYPSPRVLGAMLTVGSVYLLLLPSFDEPVLQFFERHIDDIRLGGLAAALAIMFFPVMLLGISSPFACCCPRSIMLALSRGPSTASPRSAASSACWERRFSLCL
jgi:MFS family permease